MHMNHRLRFVVAAVSLMATAGLAYSYSSNAPAMGERPGLQLAELEKRSAPLPNGVKTEVATFAAGCFWCVEQAFDEEPGVLKTVPGYTGGFTENPTYESVATGQTGHAEALQVIYDPDKVTYVQLLARYWRNVDPTDGRGQFCDRGSEYRPAIFVHTSEQRKLAEASKEALEKSGVFGHPIAVEIDNATTFTAAETEHHDYYLKHPWRYKAYKHGCGRDARLSQIWKQAGW